MPKDLEGKLSRAKVDNYHRKKLKMYEDALEWSDDDPELNEFLDDDNNLIQEPRIFSKFRIAWEQDIILGKKNRVFQRGLNLHSLKAVAKELRSKTRLRFYCKTLRGRLNCMSKDVVLPPLSNLDLEQLYEYELYKKGREQRGLDVLPYKTWLSTPACVTFYSHLDYNNRTLR